MVEKALAEERVQMVAPAAHQSLKLPIEAFRRTRLIKRQDGCNEHCTYYRSAGAYAAGTVAVKAEVETGQAGSRDRAGCTLAAMDRTCRGDGT